MVEHIVEIGSSDVVRICKEFGPTIFCDLRITALGVEAVWLIERQKITKDENNNDIVEWEEVCRIDAQESIFGEGE